MSRDQQALITRHSTPVRFISKSSSIKTKLIYDLYKLLCEYYFRAKAGIILGPYPFADESVVLRYYPCVNACASVSNDYCMYFLHIYVNQLGWPNE